MESDVRRDGKCRRKNPAREEGWEETRMYTMFRFIKRRGDLFLLSYHVKKVVFVQLPRPHMANTVSDSEIPK